jgi:hypothetical protein
MNFIRCFQILHDKGYTAFPTHHQQQHQQQQHHHGEYAIQCGVKHGFRQVVMRSPGRYEFSLLECQDRPSLDPILNILSTMIPPLLNATSLTELKICHISLVIATPGATEQSWHSDGGHDIIPHHQQQQQQQQHQPCHVLNVFVPLVNVPLELGPTELKPGTHWFTHNLVSQLLLAKARGNLQPPVIPECHLGDAVLFDYRILHRGKANRSTTGLDRTILVLTFSKPWYKDICNFPKRSMYDDKT